MYSRTKNTLTALAAAMLFVVGGWMLGHPVSKTAPPQPSVDLRLSIADAGPQDAHEYSALRIHRANRMNLTMPYFSFSQMLPQRRTD